MRENESTERAPIYPRRFYKSTSSPTWRQWNSLSVADVHALRTEPGFEGQDIYFWLNHPIQFVRLVGMVTQVDLVGNNKYALLLLDDGSGANIELKITRQKKFEADTSTEIDNVDVPVELAVPRVVLDQRPLPMGSIVRAQGTIRTFRHVRQLQLLQLTVIRDTAEEVTHWRDMAWWKRNVLAKPWVLTPEQRDAMDRDAQRERLEEEDLTRRRVEWLSKRARLVREREERKEQRRLRLSERLDAGALPGSDCLA